MNTFGNMGKSVSSLSFLKNFSWGNFLDGTQKTLGVINQAIPIVYQMKPILNNAKTMFKIADEINYSDNTNTNYNVNNSSNSITRETNLPIFYI